MTARQNTARGKLFTLAPIKNRLRKLKRPLKKFSTSRATGEVPEGSLPAPDVVLCAPEEEDIAAALEEAQRLRGEGLVVVLSDEADPELALCYAKAVGAGRFAVVTAEEEA